MTAGPGYNLLEAAVERLAGTRIFASIVTGVQKILETFGLIERAHAGGGVKLSNCVFSAIRTQAVPTLSANISASASRWSGASTSWRANTADASANGGFP